MKRRLIYLASAVTVLVIFLSALTLFSHAESYSGTCGNGLSWSLDCSDGVLYVSGSGAMSDYYSGTASLIARAPWYPYRDSIASISVGEGVTYLGQFAFDECGAVSVSLPQSLVKIGDYAFSGCSALSSVQFSEGLDELGEGAFRQCSSLSSVSFPSTLRLIGGVAFMDCTSLDNVVVPYAVTSIGNYAFSGCTGLTSFTFGRASFLLGGNVFYSCTSAGDFYYPGTKAQWKNLGMNLGISFGRSVPYRVHCTDSGANEFEFTYTVNKNTLTAVVTGYVGNSGNITVPADYQGYAVLSINDNALDSCSTVTGVTVESGITSIGTRAFRNCTAMTYAVLPDSVGTIGYGVFQSCSSLASVRLPSSLTAIPSLTFDYCASLGTVTIPGTVTTIDSLAFRYSGLTSVTLPNSVTTINDGAFSYCASLATFTFGTGVTHMGNNVFQHCSSLNNVTMPSGIDVIPSGTFNSCTSLSNLTFQQNCTRIETNAFYNTGFTSISIPNGVTDIGNSAFRECSVLGSVGIPNTVTRLGQAAFQNCTGLTGIVIPNSVATIDSYCFFGCVNLQSVDIGTGLTNSAYASFRNCRSINYVNIHDVAAWCGIEFYNNESNPAYRAQSLSLNGSVLADLVVPNGVTEIKDHVFNNVLTLTSITIPDSVTEIGGSAFRMCRNVISLDLGNGVETVGSQAFANSCFDLTATEFRLPASLKTIGSDGFQSFASGRIRTLYIGKDLTTIENGGLGNLFGLENVVYAGSHQAWERVSIGTGHDYLLNAAYTFLEVEHSISNNNFFVTISDAGTANFVRFAPGTYATLAELRLAQGLVQLNAALVSAHTDSAGVFSYEVPTSGDYTFWIRLDGGQETLLHVTLANITPYVSTDGITVTIGNLDNIRDFFIASGTRQTYRECADNKVFGATAAKLAGSHSYSYKVGVNGDYTICIRYPDGAQTFLYTSVSVPTPTYSQLGLSVTVSNISDVYVVRVAPGTHSTAGEVKRAAGCRNFSGKTILNDVNSYTIAFASDGIYTIVVQYNNCYTELHTVNIAHLVPTVTVNADNTVTFGDLDNLYIIRYAPNPKNSTDWSRGFFKQAAGNRYAKTADLTNGSFTTPVLPSLTYTKGGATLTSSIWSFMVQYSEESYSIITVNFTTGTVTWIR